MAIRAVAQNKNPPGYTGPCEAACMWCRWWKFKVTVDECEVGECRRIAPCNVNNPLGGGYALTCEFDFCGQFAAAEAKDRDRFIMPILNTRRPDL